MLWSIRAPIQKPSPSMVLSEKLYNIMKGVSHAACRRIIQKYQLYGKNSCVRGFDKNHSQNKHNTPIMLQDVQVLCKNWLPF